MHLLGKQDCRAITINNKQDENIKTHYKRDRDITWFTQYGLHPQRNRRSFIIIPSNKMMGYNLQQTHYTSSSLSHNHKDYFYNATIQYTVILQCLPFIKGIPWENNKIISHDTIMKSLNFLLN